LVITAWLVLAGGHARADVIVFKGGERQEGIVTTAPGDPGSVYFQQTMGQVKISRDRIQEVVEEPDSTDWREVGDQFFQAKRYDKALEAFKKAGTFTPPDAQLDERTKATQAALARESGTDRRKEMAKLDETLDRAEKELGAKKYPVAEVILTTETLALNPSDEQNERIKTLKTKLYKEWGLERLDKMARPAAARYFEQALALDPTDQQVYGQLLDIWSGMPEKTEQVIQAYEVQTKLHPDDMATRAKLGAKYYEFAKTLDTESGTKTEPADRDAVRARSLQTYEKAANEYEAVYGSRNLKGSDIEKGLLEVLNSLYNRARQEQDYDRALAFYKRVQKIDPKASDTETLHMEYYRDLKALAPDDVAGRVKLAERLRTLGDSEMARGEVEQLFKKYPDSQEVKDAMRVYADELLKKVQEAWGNLNYEEASTLASRCMLQYGYLPDVKEEALRIQNLANVEIRRLQQQRSGEGLRYKQLGDQYFQTAESDRDAMVTTTVDTKQTGIRNFKNDAISNYAKALDSYGKALQYTNDLSAADLDQINDRRTTSQHWYDKMTSNIVVPRITPRFNTR
jgi:tetratricopeptide (TPR) repeat protein